MFVLIFMEIQLIDVVFFYLKNHDSQVHDTKSQGIPKIIRIHCLHCDCLGLVLHAASLVATWILIAQSSLLN